MKSFSPIFEAAKSVIEDRTDLYPGPDSNGECTFECAENLQDLAKSYTENEGGDMYENHEEVVSAWRSVYGIEI